MKWLALPAAILILWLHSYFAIRVFSHEGRVLLLVLRSNDTTESWLRRNPPNADTWEALRPYKVKGLAGVVILPGRRIPRYEYRSGTTLWLADLRYALLAVPYWLLLLLSAAPATVAIARASRARSRATTGHCLTCGYDLRESHDRCPECGAANPNQPDDAPV